MHRWCKEPGHHQPWCWPIFRAANLWKLTSVTNCTNFSIFAKFYTNFSIFVRKRLRNWDKFQYFAQKFHENFSIKSVISVTKYWISVTLGSPVFSTNFFQQQQSYPGGGYSVRKLLGVCRGPLKIGPEKIEGKMVFWGLKDQILWGFVPKRSFLCWWMRKNTPKRSSLVPRGSKKGVKTAAHMYHPSYREYPPPGELPVKVPQHFMESC